MTGRFLFIPLSVLLLFSCSGKKAGSSAPVQPVSASATVAAPQFNQDSAYAYVAAQTGFGPRVPNTQAHKDCAAWFVRMFNGFGLETVSQQFKTVTFDGTELDCTNIIGQYNPDCPTRIIICSHWDSRPWADNDPDKTKHRTAIDGANDGASGVGVIMELARMVQQNPVSTGIDFILFDAEDWGPGDDFKGARKEEYWGLGTQYWAKNLHKPGYKAKYAILLDMVGGKGAKFLLEQYSVRYAKQTVDRIWDTAHSLGYSNLFLKKDGYFITDDHLFINAIAKIPSVDIVPCITGPGGSSFGPTWHTMVDNLSNIDPRVLGAVGQTLATVIYNEKP